MQFTVDNYQRWDGGIAPYNKNARDDQYGHGRSVDYRTNPRELTILPKTVKESGSVYLDLPVDGDRVGNDTYIYDLSGNIYRRTSAGSHQRLRGVAGSHGNGMHYYGEDDFLYYASDKVIGRYGQITPGSPTFVDDFLGAEGGVPLNTHSLDLEASSSQYASRADTATLSITGDLTIEATIKPESLPTVGNSMVLASKWDVSGNQRSYKFEIYAISGYFGDGSDGPLTISVDTTESPIDSACTGTSGAYTLTATNASFAPNQVIWIHQSRGTGAGTQMKNRIVSYSAGTITLEFALNANYVSGAQVRVLKQYSDVTIQSGVTYSAKAYDGSVGGSVAFLASGTVSVAGTVSATGKGYRGGAVGARGNPGSNGQCGEGTAGASATQNAANGNGGGGGGGFVNGADNATGGAGGGNGVAGSEGGNNTQIPGNPGDAGAAAGTADLTTIVFGGGGGGGGGGKNTGIGNTGNGGAGGGIVFIAGVNLVVTGAIVSSGSNGGNSSDGNDNISGAGGGGAGGSILLKVQTATLGSGLITAAAGSGGAGTSTQGSAGGNGAVGRINLDYFTSFTGTTTPTLNTNQDNVLVTTATYQLRLALSDDGTAEEFLTKNSTITIDTDAHVAVSWDASDHEAEFWQNGISLGTAVGAMTSIYNSTSVFALGCDFNSTARNFYDGLLDEVRLWSIERTTSQILSNKSVEIPATTPGLAAYFQLDNNYDDSTSNANNLTATNSPVFTTAVAFSSPTTRLDIDQSLTATANTYTLPTSISETAANRQTFVPQKDPQKSLQVEIADRGTGDWTLTVHDSVNRVVASKTVSNASLPEAGNYEFIFDSVWRPVRGASYHFHLTSTANDGTVTTNIASDLETAEFFTYYQFLVEDTHHPIADMLNFLVIGNERYVATYDAAAGYNPHRLVFPAGWRVRCFAKWRHYIVVGCFRGSSISSHDEGMLFFWDGYSQKYDFNIPVPEGGVNALLSQRGILHVWAGYQGDMIGYVGGESGEKLRRIPKITKDKYIEVRPKAVSMWQSLLRWGVGGDSDSSNIYRGVYTYGQLDQEQPISLSYDYPISTGNTQSSGIQIGLLLPVEKKLLIGWKDGAAYGVDVIDPAGNPYPTATVEKEIKDFGGVWKEKGARTVRADFEALREGESVRVKYRFDRTEDWTTGDWVTTEGATTARLSIAKGNHKEVEFAADLATTTTTSPTLLELTLEEDLKRTEGIV